MVVENFMSCCDEEKKSSCHGDSTGKGDYFLVIIVLLGIAFYGAHLLNIFLLNQSTSYFHLFHKFFELINTMSLGLVLGIIFVGILSNIPREYIISVLGPPRSKFSLVRATLAGVLLDLCSHGILMVGMTLYKRGASLGQTMAFLVASPWNSLSLTIILVSLIGLDWTLLFIFLSVVIALITGFIFDKLESSKSLPKNPNELQISKDFNLWSNLKNDLRAFSFSFKSLFDLLKTGFLNSKMILKWILFGALLSSIVSTFIDKGIFEQYFGPSLLGLGATLFVTTILEVCSEGATPLASDLLNRANAPGNSFTFLMAGVSTDYTEILSLKETTGSWKIALFLPLITVPQVLTLGYIFN